MPTREEILEMLAASQSQSIAFFQGLSPHDLERPATVSGVPGATPWSAKDHLAHLVQNERNIQQLLRDALENRPRDEFLRSQYPPGMPLPSLLGDWEALTPEEQARLELAVANLNQTTVNAHRDDTLEQLVRDYRAARLEMLDLLSQYTDEQLTTPVPTVLGEAAAGNLFAANAGHATQHIGWIEKGWRQGE